MIVRAGMGVCVYSRGMDSAVCFVCRCPAHFVAHAFGAEIEGTREEGRTGIKRGDTLVSFSSPSSASFIPFGWLNGWLVLLSLD